MNLKRAKNKGHTIVMHVNYRYSLNFVQFTLIQQQKPNICVRKCICLQLLINEIVNIKNINYYVWKYDFKQDSNHRPSEKFSCTLPTSPPLRCLCRWQTVRIIMLIPLTAKLILDVPDFFQYKQTVYKHAYGTKFRWRTIVLCHMWSTAFSRLIDYRNGKSEIQITGERYSLYKKDNISIRMILVAPTYLL